VLLIGTLCPRTGGWALTVTAGTLRPIRIEFATVPTAEQLRNRLRETISDEMYFDDVHGTPAYRKHLTFWFAEEIRQELLQGADPGTTS
jgi:hypothetical protein